MVPNFQNIYIIHTKLINNVMERMVLSMNMSLQFNKIFTWLSVFIFSHTVSRYSRYCTMTSLYYWQSKYVRWFLYTC